MEARNHVNLTYIAPPSEKFFSELGNAKLIETAEKTDEMAKPALDKKNVDFREKSTCDLGKNNITQLKIQNISEQKKNMIAVDEDADIDDEIELEEIAESADLLEETAIQVKTEGLEAKTEGLEAKTEGFEVKTEGVKAKTEGFEVKDEGLQVKSESLETKNEKKSHLLLKSRVGEQAGNSVVEGSKKKEDAAVLLIEIKQAISHLEKNFEHIDYCYIDLNQDIQFAKITNLIFNNPSEIDNRIIFNYENEEAAITEKNNLFKPGDIITKNGKKFICRLETEIEKATFEKQWDQYQLALQALQKHAIEINKEEKSEEKKEKEFNFSEKEPINGKNTALKQPSTSDNTLVELKNKQQYNAKLAQREQQEQIKRSIKNKHLQAEELEQEEEKKRINKKEVRRENIQEDFLMQSNLIVNLFKIINKTSSQVHAYININHNTTVLKIAASNKN